MDPATIAGLVLGVVPLLISAAENYEVTFQPFVTYARYAKEVQRFQAKLNAQRCSFRNECKILLRYVGQNLEDIMRDGSHPARNDIALSRRLEEALGESIVTCRTTLELINESLSEILKETQGFGDLVKSKSTGQSAFSLFRQKIKISFSKTRLTDTVNELRLYNDDLRRLSSQLRELATNSLQPQPPARSEITVHLQVAQQASKRLYEVLASRWNCDDQIEHVASMSLKVEEKCQNSSSKVRFNIALTCRKPLASYEALWLAFESAPAGPLLETAPDGRIVALREALEKMDAPSKVRFALPPDPPQVNSTITQIDLLAMGRLCRYFQQLQTQAFPPPDPYIGYMEKTNTFKHFVYRTPSPRPTPQQSKLGSKAASLRQILRTTEKDISPEYWMNKLQLARLLTLAVLRFHNTKWLPESWSSSDVQFMGKKAPGALPDWPCLTTKLVQDKPEQLTLPSPDTSASKLSQNETLYNLGIVLIELGYNTCFEDLPRKNEAGSSPQLIDFFAARQLSDSIHRVSNKTYGELVKKCLTCNFGVEPNLDSADFQGAVVTQVVNQLDVCLRQYRDFNALVT